MSGGLLAVVIIAVALAVAVAGFLAYRWLKKDMHNELDYIMTHYMALPGDRRGYSASALLDPSDSMSLGADEGHVPRGKVNDGRNNSTA